MASEKELVGLLTATVGRLLAFDSYVATAAFLSLRLLFLGKRFL